MLISYGFHIHEQNISSEIIGTWQSDTATYTEFGWVIDQMTFTKEGTITKRLFFGHTESLKIEEITPLIIEGTYRLEGTTLFIEMDIHGLECRHQITKKTVEIKDGFLMIMPIVDDPPESAYIYRRVQGQNIFRMLWKKFLIYLN